MQAQTQARLHCFHDSVALDLFDPAPNMSEEDRAQTKTFYLTETAARDLGNALRRYATDIHDRAYQLSKVKTETHGPRGRIKAEEGGT